MDSELFCRWGKSVGDLVYEMKVVRWGWVELLGMVKGFEGRLGSEVFVVFSCVFNYYRWFKIVMMWNKEEMNYFM